MMQSHRTITYHTPTHKGMRVRHSLNSKMLASTIQLQSTTPHHYQPPHTLCAAPLAAGPTTTPTHHPPHPGTDACIQQGVFSGCSKTQQYAKITPRAHHQDHVPRPTPPNTG
ncbi:hypothetical protein J2S62_001623 [Enteractinococcus fodinae]|uniref:Uncharacterized protein n=1 Tax=Enteractinococcus fodinae TaxID=684663 RepID=A0ABU2B1S2_9MICC|nr:hypothetical protein [Enteractinococcus fodinae]